MFSETYCHRSSYRLERYSCAESYECGGTHIKAISESVQLRFSGVVSDVPDTRSGGN